MSEASQALYRLIVEIRRAFHELGAFADAEHADIGVTGAMRALMEHLADNGAATVPDIAREKTVSRQHIQQIANALQDAGLLEWRDNPRHKRSQLAELTGLGKARFALVRAREGVLLEELAAELAATDLAGAADAVYALREALKKPRRAGKRNPARP